MEKIMYKEPITYIECDKDTVRNNNTYEERELVR